MSRFAFAVLNVSGFVSFSFAQEPISPVAAESMVALPTEVAPSCCPPIDWSKLPAVRPFPRQGFFSIPPTGCGSYTLLDSLRGRTSDKPAKFGYPPFALYGQPFFDTDWRYLDDPKTPPADVLDEIKRTRLGEHWLLTTGGSAWWRSMSETNSRLTQADNTYSLPRIRSYADLWYEDKFRFYIEGIFADSIGHDLAPLAIDRNRADFLNLFAEASLGTWGDQQVSVRLGRQELLFGSQRLITSLEWANTRRTFQGGRLLSSGEQWDYDLFWVQPVVQNPSQLDSVDNNQNFAGAWATYKPKKGTTADFYYLMLDNTNNVTQQGITRAPFTTHTLGTRFAGDLDNKLLWDFEAAMQLGRNGSDDIVAGMATAGIGYHFAGVAWNPTVWAYYDYASGDGSPNSGLRQTFNPQFPFGHLYLGWTDLVGRQNVHDVNAHLYLYPAHWLTVWTQYHYLQLARANDALYNPAGVAYRRDPTGNAGRQVGHEVDVVANAHISKRGDVMLGYSQLIGGSFLKNTSGPNASANASVFFAQFVYRW